MAAKTSWHRYGTKITSLWPYVYYIDPLTTSYADKFCYRCAIKLRHWTELPICFICWQLTSSCSHLSLITMNLATPYPAALTSCVLLLFLFIYLLYLFLTIPCRPTSKSTGSVSFAESLPRVALIFLSFRWIWPPPTLLRLRAVFCCCFLFIYLLYSFLTIPCRPTSRSTGSIFAEFAKLVELWL